VTISIATFLLAAISYRYLESPLLALGRRPAISRPRAVLPLASERSVPPP
jgi:peptidoglycan/LPS O-acetylase OafA/YrhL